MPKQNRVTPFGDIIATPARGAFTGNRGILHNERQEIIRPYQSKAWIICRLAYKGQRRTVMSPNTWTELFFLDEATALAAGHRPCFACRRERALAFRAAWLAANETSSVPRLVDNGRASQIDRVLHEERLTPARYTWDRRKRTTMAMLDDLPDGTFIQLALPTGLEPPWKVNDTIACLIWGGQLWPWTAEGYLAPLPRPSGRQVTVLTPPSTVGALAHGYIPVVALEGDQHHA